VRAPQPEASNSWIDASPIKGIDPDVTHAQHSGASKTRWPAELLPRSYTISGRAVAHEHPDLRPRVDGVIQKIIYQLGVTLEVGDPLFELDDAVRRV
jgi:multidrug efflux pump subunit AcrA (membrane-fusion protein)